MSAAIEGIQTCFHESHLQVDYGLSPSIIHRNALIFPGLLIGFAVVSSIMQWCIRGLHQISQRELESPFCLDQVPKKIDARGIGGNTLQLDVAELEQQQNKLKRIRFEPFEVSPSNRCRQELKSSRSKRRGSYSIQFSKDSKLVSIQFDDRGLQTGDRVPRSLSADRYINTGEDKSLRLKSIRFLSQDLDLPKITSLGTKGALESCHNHGIVSTSTTDVIPLDTSRQNAYFLWDFKRNLISPVALSLGAMIIFVSSNGMYPEVISEGHACLKT